MARAIANNSTLKALHVHGNVLKEDGPKHIARALATNIVSLSLSLSLGLYLTRVWHHALDALRHATLSLSLASPRVMRLSMG